MGLDAKRKRCLLTVGRGCPSLLGRSAALHKHDDQVSFLEHKLLHEKKEQMPDEGIVLPLSETNIVREYRNYLRLPEVAVRSRSRGETLLRPRMKLSLTTDR